MLKNTSGNQAKLKHKKKTKKHKIVYLDVFKAGVPVEMQDF